MHTPWGNSDSSKSYGDGITFYGTPSHGGFKLSEDNLTEFKKIFPNWKSAYAPDGWFEEDLDWALVAIAFPEAFKIESLRGAFWTVSSLHGQEYFGSEIFLWLRDSEQGRKIHEQVQEFERKNVAKWEVGSMSSRGGGDRRWNVGLTRVGDGAHKVVVIAYPEDRFLSDEEVETLIAAAPDPPKVRTPERDAFGRQWGDSRSLEDCHSDADPGL